MYFRGHLESVLKVGVKQYMVYESGDNLSIEVKASY